MKSILIPAVVCSAAALAALQVPSAPAGALLVLAKTDQTLSVVDPSSLKVLGRVPSGPDPHEVAVSDDGRTAYIANYNGGGNIITPVDLVAMKALPPIDLGALRAPHGVWFAGGKLWFTAEASKAIGRYDPASRKVDWILGTGQNRTHMIHVSRDLGRIVTSNVSSATARTSERGAPCSGRIAAAIVFTSFIVTRSPNRSKNRPNEDGRSRSLRPRVVARKRPAPARTARASSVGASTRVMAAR